MVMPKKPNSFIQPVCLTADTLQSTPTIRLVFYLVVSLYYNLQLQADANMIAEADYCWFVGWGFTGARPSSQQVKPNDLARVLQQSRHYLMEHDTCNQILDAWNIDKKVPYRFLCYDFLVRF